jgi:Ca2+-binding RTX toxin-like protein
MAAQATCPTTPQNFALHDCTVDGNTVCTTTSTEFVCDVSWSDEPAYVALVKDFSTTSLYEAWGTVNGDLFCCPSAANVVPTDVRIEGSAWADTLSFTSTSLTYNLVGAGTSITAIINGGDEDDQINGSHGTSNITETLNGEAGKDVIRGNAGADVLNGGDGDDLMLGGSGDDTLNGGNGSDEMLGGTGDDEMNGDADRDFMGGGDNNDVMDGGTGGDTLCGDNESGSGGDDLDDGDTVDEGAGLRDILWSATLPDTARCNHASTLWDGGAGVHTCSGNPPAGVRPACP